MTAIAPEHSGSLATLQDNIVDSAVMGALEGTDDPNEPLDGAEAVEQATEAKAVADKAAKAEKAAEGLDNQTKLKITEIAEEPDVSRETKRNPDGTFAKVKETPKAETKVDGVPQPTADAEPTPEPPKEKRVLATEFKAYGKDGTELDVHDVVDQLEIEIPWKKSLKNPDGVLRAPLDRIARLAQAGIHNEERDAEVKSYLAERTTLQEELADAKERIRKQNAYVASLLDSDEVLADSRAKWQSHNTPEARAERAERRAMELEQQLEGKTSAETATSFYERDVKAPLEALRAKYPTVTEREIIGEFNILTAKYGPVIHPRDYAAVRDILRAELPAFAASVHETRVADESKLRKVQESNALLKRSQAMGARPIGRTASAAEAKPVRKAPTTMDERIEHLIDDEILQGF